MIRITEGFPEWAWPKAWKWATDRRSQFADDFFPPTLDSFVESYSVRFQEAWTYGVWKDDYLGGAIIFEQASPVVVTAHILLSRRLRGIPVSELRQAGAMLFQSRLGLIRIQAFVPAWNRAAIALAVKLGGTVEGVLRGATMRGGKPADVALIGITREEFYGTESRRILRIGEKQRDGNEHEREHIFAGTVLASERSGVKPLDGPEGVGRGNPLAGSSGAEDPGSGRDQQDIGRADRTDQHVPRGARVRKKRSDGKGNSAGGTRQGK